MSPEGEFYRRLQRSYSKLSMEQIGDIIYVPRMLELLQTPLNEDESKKILAMIGARLHLFYKLYTSYPLELNTILSLGCRIRDFLSIVGEHNPYLFPKLPKVVCDESNNTFESLDSYHPMYHTPVTDIFIKLSRRIVLFQIRLSAAGVVLVKVCDPYKPLEADIEEDSDDLRTTD